MRQRAISVDLIPEVEDECIDDLANFCFDKTQKGEEMQCLQDNLEKLMQKCKVIPIVLAHVTNSFSKTITKHSDRSDHLY